MSIKFFSPKRFGLYLKQYISANIKMWLLLTLAAIGVMVVLFFVSESDINYKKDPIRFFQIFENHLQAFYIISFFAMGLLLTITSFNQYSSKRSGVFYLMLPATTFEKLLAHWVVTVPGFFITFQLIWIITSMIINCIEGMITGLHLGLFVPAWEIKSPGFFLFFVTQAFFFAGTALTGKSSFIKTTIAALGIIILIVNLKSAIDYFAFNNGNLFSFSVGYGLNSPALHVNTLITVMQPILILFIPVCYTLAYCFLKEREV